MDAVKRRPAHQDPEAVTAVPHCQAEAVVAAAGLPLWPVGEQEAREEEDDNVLTNKRQGWMKMISFLWNTHEEACWEKESASLKNVPL